MTTTRYNPKKWLPDLGEFENDGWLSVKNVIPFTNGWLPEALMVKRKSLSSPASIGLDIRGFHINPANGTDGWKIYLGNATKLYEVEPNGWAITDLSGATYTVDDVSGWQFVAYGSNEIAVAGHSQEALVRVNDAGNFEGLITNAQPDLLGFSRCWQEDNSGAPDYVNITTDCNDSGASDAQPFPDTAAVNDAVYFGRFNALPAALSIKVGTAGVGTYTVTWEYYNGSWTALSGVTDNTTGFTVAGVSTVVYTVPTDSTAFVVNGSPSLHWIRGRISAFTSMTTNPLLTQIGEHTAWPPQPKYVANWKDAVAIANYANVGPATEHGDPDPSGIWISDVTGRVFGTAKTHPGDRTTYLSLTDEHGPITGLIGGDEFGAVLKPSAIYRAKYGGVFRVDIRVASASLGSIFPNAWAWAGPHELYLMTSSGPAVMTQDEVRPIGINEFQKSVLEQANAASMRTSQTKPYLITCTYSNATDVVSWYWNHTGSDTPDIQFNYHRGSRKASFCNRDTVANRIDATGSWGTNFSATVIGAATIPVPAVSDWTPMKDVLLLAHEEGGASLAIWAFETLSEFAVDGVYRWNGYPEFESPFLELVRYQKSKVSWLRPIYSRTFAATSNTVTVSVKNRPSATVNAKHVATTSTEDASGLYKITRIPEMYWSKIKVAFGVTLTNIEYLVDLDGTVDIGYEKGADLDA